MKCYTVVNPPLINSKATEKKKKQLLYVPDIISQYYNYIPKPNNYQVYDLSFMGSFFVNNKIITVFYSESGVHIACPANQEFYLS